jgi:hypothetical protein
LSEIFFTDRDLGTRFAEILRARGIVVERHVDHFAPDTSDEEWLETVGRRGWVAVTHDRRIRYKPNELAAVRRHRVMLLVVVGKASLPDLAQSFVLTLPQIRAFLDAHKPPFIAKVYRHMASPGAPPSGGHVVLWSK